MEALILSCSTGGGHNTAAQAVFEALTERGHHAVRMDPYTLVSEELANKVGQTYIKLVQKSPKLFGAVYDLGNAYRKLPGRSPVYHINGKMAPHMQKYLAEHLTDVIVCTHLYPAEILTHMRLNGMETPPFVFIATDYTCVPFTEESDCDLYVTPSPLLGSDFTGRGIPAEKLRPLGIPVRLDFSDDTITKDRAREALNLPKDRRTLLLSGGSMGAGSIINAVLCNTVCAVRCCVKQKPAAAESFCVFSGGGVYGWRKPADKRGLPRTMRGSPPERFTGKSGLSRVLLVADVLGLGGVEGQVADGSHDLVDSEGHDVSRM